MKRVVVTGIGALTPIGNNVAEYLDGLRNGRSGAGPITQFDASRFKTQFACEVKNFNPEDFIEKREVRRLDRFSQFALVTADQAILDCGADLATLDLDRVGVIWGSGIGGLNTMEVEIEAYLKGDGTPRHNPFLIPKMISDIAAGMIRDYSMYTYYPLLQIAENRDIPLEHFKFILDSFDHPYSNYLRYSGFPEMGHAAFALREHLPGASREQAIEAIRAMCVYTNTLAAWSFHYFPWGLGKHFVYNNPQEPAPLPSPAPAAAATRAARPRWPHTRGRASCRAGNSSGPGRSTRG